MLPPARPSGFKRGSKPFFLRIGFFKERVPGPESRVLRPEALAWDR
jgi:hypothetical protein